MPGDRKEPKPAYKSEFLSAFHDELKHMEKTTLKDRLSGGINAQFKTYSGGEVKETKQEFRTGSGDFAVKRFYTPLDTADIDPITDIGLPGQMPFTRGRDPLGFRAHEWPLSYYAGYGSGESASERYKELYASGARELALALDLPTQIGLDSDAPMAAGEVGKVGLALDTCDDLLRALETIPLAEVRLATVGNCNSPWILAMFHTLAEANGHDPKDMRFQIQNDPIKEYTGRGTYIFPPSVAIDISSDVTEFICKNLPNWAPQYNCTTTMRWGGSSASQEVGFGIANLLCYIEAAQAKGVDPADFVPRLHLHMSSDNDLFEEVAKFRAVRRLWAKIAGERLKTDDPRILALRTTVYTAGDKLTAQEPLNNITRTTMHVLAALLGGADNIVVPAYDEALALPTFESARVATLIKNILHDECYVGQTADPLGGSYFVESLTTQIEDKAYDWYRQVEDMGGPVAALENGFYLKEMSDGMYRQFTEVETGERTVIGVNKHIRDTETKIDIFKGDPEAEQRQINRLKEARANRDQTRVTAALAEVRRVAEVKKKGERENIVPSFLEAVRARATIGEIYDELRDVFGVYHAPNVV